MQKIKANLVGIGILTLLAMLIYEFTPINEFGCVFYAFLYIAWVFCAFFIWNHKKSPESPMQWFLLTVNSILIATAWLIISKITTHLFFMNSSLELSKFFDNAVLLAIAPGFTCIAFSGWVRAFFIRRKNQFNRE